MIVFIYKRLKKDIDEARKRFLFLPNQLTYMWRIRMIMLPRQALDIETKRVLKNDDRFFFRRMGGRRCWWRSVTTRSRRRSVC
eukprot:COSAG06_NODE_669_length_13222_cov_8.235922_12_plen_83_part_00